MHLLISEIISFPVFKGPIHSQFIGKPDYTTGSSNSDALLQPKSLLAIAMAALSFWAILCDVS
jgi:hypothetical protein